MKQRIQKAFAVFGVISAIKCIGIARGVNRGQVATTSIVEVLFPRITAFLAFREAKRIIRNPKLGDYRYATMSPQSLLMMMNSLPVKRLVQLADITNADMREFMTCDDDSNWRFIDDDALQAFRQLMSRKAMEAHFTDEPNAEAMAYFTGHQG